MTPTEDYETVAIITTILSILSIIGSSWIIKTAYNRKRKDTENEDYLVNDYVLYMSICDVCTHIITLIYYSTVAARSDWISNWTFPVCWIFGFIFQFSLISSATWSFAIAVNLFLLINGKDPTSKPESWNIGCNIYVKRHKVRIWMFSLICSLIPSADYGFTPNEEEKVGIAKYECWMQHPGYQMTLYGPVSVYVVLTIAILCQIMLMKCKCIPSYTQYASIQKKLALYSVLFAFVWLWPCINRYYGFAKNEPPFVIVALHHILLSSVGLGNSIIWTVSFLKPTQLPSRHSTSLLQNDQLYIAHSMDHTDEL